ncbi:hypothetical protein [Anaerocaecibacter muris]|uniref:hypothetical protein n=1 Tax=Anaerocaecibacter muris TaxID=2941513 RepID=UPI003F68E5E2
MKDNIRRIIPFVISGLTIIVTFVLQFVALDFDRAFSWSDFLPQFFINLFLLITTSVIWLNSGTDRAKNDDKSAYKQNVAIYATQIKKLTDDGRLADLRAYCKVKTDELLESKITTVLANVGIDRKLYENTLKTLSVAKLKQDGYTRRQIRIIERVKNGKVRVTPIHYMDLLCDSRTMDDCGVNYDERADKTLRISFRAVRSAVMTLVLALLAIDLARDITNLNAWIMFAMRLFTIVWTAFSSEHEGYARITETKNKVILRRIAFLHEFDEWASVPRLVTGKSDGL